MRGVRSGLAPSFPCDSCLKLISLSLEADPLYLIYIDDDLSLRKISVDLKSLLSSGKSGERCCE